MISLTMSKAMAKPMQSSHWLPLERSQAQAALQEVQLGRQDDEQQGQAVEHHLVSIVQEIPDWERAQGFTVAG